MTDTERTERVELVELDLTPTTTPSWVAKAQLPALAPAPRGKRIARGTIPPPLGMPRLPVVARPVDAYPVKLVSPPRRWGRVVAVGLDGAPIRRARTVTAVPARRVSPTLLAGVLAAAIVPLAIALAMSSPARAAAAPVVSAPAPVVAEPTITPLLAPDEGLLALDASSPCRILIDGRDTGLTTPQRELRLAAGRHRITLIDDAHGLEDHSEVVIGAAPVTLTRDLSAFIR